MSATPPSVEETLWPRSVQVAAALLVVTTLGLLVWHGHLGSRAATRPSQIQRPTAHTPSDPGDPEESEEDTPKIALKRPPTPARDSRKPMPAVGIKKVADGDVRIDVNTATLTELQKLPGIGPTIAARIIERREEKPFETTDDLRKVKGIGVKILDRLRPVVTVGGAHRTVSTEQ